MSEFNPPIDLEPSQEALGHAWKTLAGQVILHAKTITATQTERPATDTSAQPYTFEYELDKAFTRDFVADDPVPVTESRVSYYSPHRPSADSDEFHEVVSIDWTEHEAGARVKVDRSMTIRKVQTEDQSQFVAYESTQYVSVETGLRESRGVSDTPDDSDYTHSLAIHDALRDRMDDTEPFSLDTVEKIHRIADFIEVNPS